MFALLRAAARILNINLNYSEGEVAPTGDIILNLREPTEGAQTPTEGLVLNFEYTEE